MLQLSIKADAKFKNTPVKRALQRLLDPMGITYSVSAKAKDAVNTTTVSGDFHDMTILQILALVADYSNLYFRVEHGRISVYDISEERPGANRFMAQCPVFGISGREVGIVEIHPASPSLKVLNESRFPKNKKVDPITN